NGNAHLAQRRLQRWRSQAPFATDSAFAERLALDGLSEEDLFRLLGEPIEAVHSRCPLPLAWLTELAQAFARAPSVQPLPVPESFKAHEVMGLLDVIEPLLSQGPHRLHQAVGAL